VVSRRKAARQRLVMFHLGLLLGGLVVIPLVMTPPDSHATKSYTIPAALIEIGRYVCGEHGGFAGAQAVTPSRFRFECRDTTAIEHTVTLK